MKKETWRALPGGTYEASTHGKLRRVIPVRVSQHRDGYLKAFVKRGGGSYTRFVHTLVAEAFIGARPKGKVVNHRNGKKTDNRPENLEYVTPKRNAEHAAALGLYVSGERHYRAKLTDGQVRLAKRMYSSGHFTFSQLAREFGVTRATIHKAVRGRTYANRRS